MRNNTDLIVATTIFPRDSAAPREEQRLYCVLRQDGFEDGSSKMEPVSLGRRPNGPGASRERTGRRLFWGRGRAGFVPSKSRSAVLVWSSSFCASTDKGAGGSNESQRPRRCLFVVRGCWIWDWQGRSEDDGGGGGGGVVLMCGLALLEKKRAVKKTEREERKRAAAAAGSTSKRRASARL